MWDSIISQSNVSRLLPANILWRLERLDFDGATMRVRVENKEECKAINISFDPVYYSISDDFVEDYGGMNGAEGQKNQTSFGSVDDVLSNIGKSVPDSRPDYDDLKVYKISAMQWMMRFACFGKPIVVEQALNEKVQNAH